MTRRWYLVSLVPMLFGVILGLATFLSAYVNVKEMPRLVVPGEKTLHLTAGLYLVYGEYDSVVDGTAYHAGELTAHCTLHDAAGTSIPVEPSRSSTKYRFLAYDGRSMFQASIPTPGDYTLACETRSQPMVVAIGHNVGISLIIGIVSFLAGVIGAAIALVVVWRRRKRTLPKAQVATGS